MTKKIIIVLFFALLGFIIYFAFFRLSSPFNDFFMKNDDVKHSVPLDKIFSGGPPRDGIPSIDDPKFVSVEEADKYLNDEGLGIGVEIGDTIRYYPFQIIVWHELVNDFIEDEPVLISFCPLCGTGIAFERKINGEAVEFGTSGRLFNSDLVMYDRKFENLWSEILGEAIVGDLTGTKLKVLPSENLLWKDWKVIHPQGQVLSQETGFRRDYSGAGPYGNYNESSNIFFPVENKDDRLFEKTRVLGIEINGKFKAYAEEDVRKVGKITEEFAGTNLEISFDDAKKDFTFLNKDIGEEIISTHLFWFAWVAFHPDTELFQIEQ